MSRIKDIAETSYSSDLKVLVDSASLAAPKTLNLSAVGNMKTVNGILPDENGNVNLGFNENELYKFKRVNSFDNMEDTDIRSGFIYYTTGDVVEGKSLVYINKMCVAENLWTFVTPTTHTVMLDSGTYEIVAVGGGGDASFTTSYLGHWAASGGSGALVKCFCKLDAAATLSVIVGAAANPTTISLNGSVIVKAANGTSGDSWYGGAAGGKGGKAADCIADADYCSEITIIDGNDGSGGPMSNPSGGQYASPEFKYGGGQGTGESYNPQTGYVRISKIAVNETNV